MSWRSGDFDRDRVPEVFHRFVPAHAAESLQAIDLDRLWSGGKRLILLDVDHTIVKWKAEEFSPEVLDWIARAKQMGFGLCIISNTRRPQRLQRLSEKLGIETVRGKFKPSRAMFRLALIKFKCTSDQAVMIGDQLITDILGANRAGINAIWVRKMEGKEFAGTKVNRLMERVLRSVIYKGLVAPIDEEPQPGDDPESLPDRPVIHQLVRFGIVGGSSFLVDFGIRWILTFHTPWKGHLLSDVFGSWLQSQSQFFAQNFVTPQNAAVPFFVVISASLAIVNSFIWNRLWTFEIRGKEERMAQFRRFVLVSVVGMLLNVVISSTLANVITGHRQRSLAIATVIATAFVAIWNFLGQRYYAFKPRKVDTELEPRKARNTRKDKPFFEWREAPAGDFGVIGDPVSHSLSPRMHSAAFAALGLNLTYRTIRVPAGEVTAAIQHLRSIGYRGLNVTVPHKAEARAALAEVDDFAGRCDAANTIRLEDLYGINTDGDGFLDTLASQIPKGCRVLLIGAGGSARAIALALALDGYNLRIFNRTRERALSLVRELAIEAEVVDHPGLQNTQLIVNATSASLHGESLPVSFEGAPAGALAYDLLYGETPFLRTAHDAGLRTMDGKRMLVAQGARSLEFWIPGLRAPRDVMLEAIS
ncbi:MAG: shikimate dehydrogenase [Fimbriimonadales bacterium]